MYNIRRKQQQKKCIPKHFALYTYILPMCNVCNFDVGSFYFFSKFVILPFRHGSPTTASRCKFHYHFRHLWIIIIFYISLLLIWSVLDCSWKANVLNTFILYSSIISPPRCLLIFLLFGCNFSNNNENISIFRRR